MTEPRPLEQAGLPHRFRVPPLVQPAWRWADLGSAADPEPLCKALCTRFASRHCLLIDQARSALPLLVLAMGLTGRWVLSNVNYLPIAQWLASPTTGVTFVDVDDDLTLNPDALEHALMPGVEALLVNHMYGKPAAMARIAPLARRHGVFVVENAVHLSGNADADGRPAGSWGDATMVSFGYDKPLGALGGGALLTNDDTLWECLERTARPGTPITRPLRAIAQSYSGARAKPWLAQLPGIGGRVPTRLIADWSSNPDSKTGITAPASAPHRLQVAAARGVLDRAGAQQSARREAAERLSRALATTGCVLPVDDAGRPHTFSAYPVLLPIGADRLAVAQRLADQGIESRWRYLPLDRLTSFHVMGATTVPTAGAAEGHPWDRHLLLPCPTSLTSAQATYIAEALESALMAA